MSFPPRRIKSPPTFQVLWWGLLCWRWKPRFQSGHGFLFRWTLRWGPLELRRWL